MVSEGLTARGMNSLLKTVAGNASMAAMLASTLSLYIKLMNGELNVQAQVLKNKCLISP
jgi:hypothetical protein